MKPSSVYGIWVIIALTLSCGLSKTPATSKDVIGAVMMVLFANYLSELFREKEKK